MGIFWYYKFYENTVWKIQKSFFHSKGETRDTTQGMWTSGAAASDGTNTPFF